MNIINITKGQKWTSKTHPQEDFIIYDWISKSGEMGDEEVSKAKEEDRIYFWMRTNEDAFEQSVKEKKGYSVKELIVQGKNTYPYAWCGETGRSALVNKIKKYNMKLMDNEVVF